MPNSSRSTAMHNPMRVTVLIVDDNTSGAQTLKIVLELGGYDVLVASTGRDALELFNQHLPGVVLLDINLPDMDGYSVAQALRRIRNTQPTLILALTGRAADGDERDALLAGCDFHLSKPVDFDKLEEVMHARVAQCTTTHG